MKLTKRILAMLMALAMVLSLVPATHAHAEETETETTETTATPESSSSYEPWAHGYRFVDILNWTPETDDYSEELVAKVPLQNRIATYAATQANPDLIDDAQLYVISSSNYRNTDTTNGPWNAGMAYDEFSYNLFKFWQYADYTGAGGRPTEQIDEETKNYIGSFEYGTIAIPQASATNAAHKNGVMSLAEYFVPRNPQYTEEWLYQAEDGSYPYAQKLVEIANYYGFDGYFVNQEENIPSSYVPLFRDMLVWMREQGLYIQWYDSIGDGGSISYRNKFEDYNDSWVWNEEDGRVSDSIFLNYWYSSTALKDSKAHAESLGLDPYEVVFMGVEGGQWKFGTDIETRYNAVDENGQPYTSFAIWGSDWYQDQFDRADDARYKDEYQWGVEERERIYFTSATENAGTYSTGEVTRDDIDAGTINFQGFSKYVVEKSVIDGTVFASDFNNGHGMQYFRNGEVSRDMEWSNLNLQDILPTWQWWIETEGETLSLEMDWDYGTKHTRHQGAFDYTQVGAYNGGSSIVVYGDLSDTHTVNLYKTELDVTEGSSIALTYHKTSADDASQIGIAVTFQAADGATETVVLPISDSGKQTGWTTAEVALGEYAGKVIAAIGVQLSTEEAVEGYQINLGRLVVSDGASHTPAAPTGVKLEKNFDSTNELQLSWDIADYASVPNYHIYAIYADGSERFVGGAYAENYYIQTLENRANVTALEVRAVGVDGTESAGTRVSLTNNGISNVQAASGSNKLTVTWDGGEAEVSLAYWYSEKEAPAALTGDGTVTFDIDLEDGEDYILTLTNAAGSVNYFGELADTYCGPYEGEPRKVSDGKYNFTMPLEGDWYTLDMNVNGSTTTYKRFGGSSMEGINVGTSGLTTVTITLTDLYGNVSAPMSIVFLNGEVADLSTSLSPELFPDEMLRYALEQTVGTSLQELLDYTGALDLSDYGIADLTGLSMLTGVTELDLSGNAITELTADMLPPALTKLTLDNCSELVSIDLDGKDSLELVLGDLPALTDLSLEDYGPYALDLSGCPELLNLYLTGAQLTELDITACVKLHNFKIDDSQIASLTAADASAYTNCFIWDWSGAKLDLSQDTFFEGIKNYFDTTEIPDEISTEETQKGYSSISSWSTTRTISLGGETLLSSVEVLNYYPDWYDLLTHFTVETSTDGETFELVAEITDATESYTYEFPEGTKATHVRIKNVDSADCWAYVYVYGYDMVSAKFLYTGQQPAMVKDDIQALEVSDDNTTYQTKELLEAWYASAHTVASGTYAADLADADWIDQAYLAEQSVAPKGVKVVITDENGNAYEYPTEGPTLGAIEDTALTVEPTTVYTAHEYGNEEGYRMFDGLATTKWCGREYSNWLVFELAEARVLGQWYTMHAGSEDKGMISADFRLQVLDPEVITDEDYLAMDESGKRSVAGNASNWKDLSVVTGNTENEVLVEVDYDALATAQVYRFIVDTPAQPDGNSWGALRVYEMALYAYEGELGANVNGLLKADTVGHYDISFQRAGTELNKTSITVGHVLSDWYQHHAASCDETGLMKRECAHCDYEENVVLAALGHTWDEGTVTLEPTCTAEGEKTYTCSVCGDTKVEPIAKVDHVCTAEVTAPTCELPGYTTYTCHCGYNYVGDVVAALGHTYESVVTEPTCDRMGYTTHTCATCGHSYVDTYVAALDHEFEMTVTLEATCVSEGEATFTCVHEGCTETYTMVLPVSEHAHSCETVVHEATCEGYGYTANTCTLCGHSYLTDLAEPLGHDYQAVVTEATCTEGGYTTHTCSRCEDRYMDSYVDALGHDNEDGTCSRCASGMIRLAGDNRVQTAMKAADQLKEALGVEQFQTIIVAYGQNFPDALTGSYLSAVKDAPILLTENKKQADVIAYIAENLAEGGTVYILGGVNAIPASFESDLEAKAISSERLAGDDRYQTNLAILAEAGITAEQEVLVCTGTGFADSLSASAAGLPILLVGKELKAEQKEFLATTSGKFVIIGGTSAVSEEVEAELSAIGTVERVGGETRYETSVLVAQRFVNDPTAAVLAYAQNFPDGLCGGPLAYALGAPLILTDTKHPDAADAYVENIVTGIIVGGSSLISDDAARNIFDLPEDAVIKVK